MATVFKILRPEVRQAHYALHQGLFYRCEDWHDGSQVSWTLPRPPVGARCRASGDGWRSWYEFTVPASAARPPSGMRLLYLIVALLAVPVSLVVLPGSCAGVAALAGLAVAVLALAGLALEHLASRDPAAAARLGVLVAVDLAAHAAVRHAHAARSPRW